MPFRVPKCKLFHIPEIQSASPFRHVPKIPAPRCTLEILNNFLQSLKKTSIRVLSHAICTFFVAILLGEEVLRAENQQ